jgi:hypothetical protein
LFNLNILDFFSAIYNIFVDGPKNNNNNNIFNKLDIQTQKANNTAQVGARNLYMHMGEPFHGESCPSNYGT